MASYSVDQLLKMGPVQLNALIRPYKEIDAEATQTLHNYCRHHLAAACHSSHLTPGVKWEDIGPNRPKRGREYLNEALVAKLRQGKVAVTREDLACMAKEARRTMPGVGAPIRGMRDLSYDTFIKVGDSFASSRSLSFYTRSLYFSSDTRLFPLLRHFHDSRLATLTSLPPIPASSPILLARGTTLRGAEGQALVFH